MSGRFGRFLGVACIVLGTASAGTAVAQTPVAPAPAATAPANASFAPVPATPPAESSPPVADGAPAPPAAAPAPVAESGYAPAPPAPVEVCSPSCRSGYSCHQGQCLSRCNPACGPGERCLANGECELPQAKAKEAPPAHDPILGSRGIWAFDARVGIELSGSGKVHKNCSANGSFSCNTTTFDIDDASLVMLGLDAMLHLARGVRLGAGYQLVPYSAARSNPPEALQGDRSKTTFHAGHEHQLSAIVEGLVPLGDNMAMALRAQGGLRMLVLAGDLAQFGDDTLSFCNVRNAQHCEVDQGPLFGGGLGTMVGFIVGQKLRFRGDLAMQYDALAWPGRKLVLADGNLTSDAGYSMTRFWLLAGVEL